MAKAVLLPPFSTQWFGGREEIVVPSAATIFALVRALETQAPGFAEAAQRRAAVAVNGQAIADWSCQLAEADEVLFVPKIAGG
ncbi:MAG: MoaD/ThiS family protein [Novosphingobium sp.]